MREVQYYWVFTTQGWHNPDGFYNIHWGGGHEVDFFCLQICRIEPSGEDSYEKQNWRGPSLIDAEHLPC